MLIQDGEGSFSIERRMIVSIKGHGAFMPLPKISLVCLVTERRIILVCPITCEE